MAAPSRGFRMAMVAELGHVYYRQPGVLLASVVGLQQEMSRSLGDGVGREFLDMFGLALGRDGLGRLAQVQTLVTQECSDPGVRG